MPHLRKRHAQPIFEEFLKFSPIVGVFGHRQVGKTTFLEGNCKSYQSFDSTEVQRLANQNPARFLSQLGAKPSGIDECQMVPSLFPQLKEYVRKNKTPGRIVLSGSVRFSSRAAIKESLTGRIVSVELLPFVLTEILEVERSRLVLKLLSATSFSDSLSNELSLKEFNTRMRALAKYEENGGLPGLCFLRNKRLQNEKLREQLEMLLGRDLKLVYPTTVPDLQIREFVEALARLELRPVATTKLRRSTRISEATQKRLLQALEAIFVTRLLPIEGDRRGLSLYFEDHLERKFLLGDAPDPQQDFEGLVLRNLRASFNYESGMDYKVFQWQSGKARIPFVFRAAGAYLGIIPTLETHPSRRELNLCQRFLAQYPNSTVLIITKNQRSTEIITPKILKIPAAEILF
jgi:predicted AAA+ superfamily ATPase